jgi:[NiFe] hydrogenase assembly HybE family chaperone
MQTLTADEYALLAELAKAYRDVHLPSIKQKSDWNPRLGVDALCFQHHGAEHLVGALITPCELWLIGVPQPALRTESMAETLTLSLPSGAYRLSHERLPGGYQLYKRAILSDLSELESMQEAARLAQQMMTRLMQPAEVPNA